jgi:3-phenylpropionate/cinnamic acid dioxygenase small subunit
MAAAKKKKPVKKVIAAKKKTPARKLVSAPKKTGPATKPSGADLQQQVEQFLFRQAEVLDCKQWQAYIDLFAADGVYWNAVDPAHTDWDGVPSIFTEDRDLMTVRMKRVLHPNAASQEAEWGTSHIVSNVVIEKVNGNEVHVRSRFHMLEMRRDDLRHFAGTYRHHLEKTRDGWRIKLQRVDMLNAQMPFEYVLQVWV